ncbi:nuclear condensing complex subunit [Roridomyces roridus]|uniref:Nuclear condensing complex subunit n=1 Tax=Roridomyces roridus TaxID=1738132 RepID=A0AAD7BZU4_9AGAR|nr:nuclear condensing complex subunit [Roridomyces roridus]
MAPRPDDALESIQQSLAAIFDQAQTSLANHKKNCVALYKIHLKSSEKNSKSKKRPDQGQAAFLAAFLDMVSRVVAVKKGTAAVDRIIKFVAQYVLFVNEKAGSSEDETLASAFVSRMLEWLIQGFVAKNKAVRYQTVHLVAEMISYLGEIDEESYLSLRANLIQRSTCDKESTVRAQAVSALARLVGSEDPAELGESEKSILDVLLDIMAFDPSAEVRRAALVHVPVTADTLDHVLSRARDVDPVTRKLVYTTVLPRLAHPRHLTIEQRERVVQTGLGDREPAVRLAAGKMMATWFDLVTSEPPSDFPWAGDDGGIMHALIGFLNLFDVVGPGEAVAVDAILALSSARSGLFDSLYWKNLTPESAVLTRVFVERPELTEDRLERAGLPVAYNQLLSAMEDTEVARALGSGEDVDGDMDAAEEAEEEVAKREIVLGELLRMAVKLDYMDEIGRRKVYSVTRDMLAHPQLPPGLIARCLDVMKEILPTERELIRVVVEIVIDLREGDSEEPEEEMNDQDTTQSDIRKERSMRRAKAREDMTAEEGARADVMDLRCLEVCNGMLERVHENFADNSTLEGILADLIIPAVKRKELSIREKGLVGLGLCCLLSKNIALNSLQLFLSQIQQSAVEELRLSALKSLFDLMVLYDRDLFTRSEDEEKVLKFLGETLDYELDAESEGSARVQAIMCIGLAKLLLAGLVTDPKATDNQEQILKSLLLAYVSPVTADNAELRQCLAYFFSVYCYSSAENQSRLRAIFLSAFGEVMKMHDGLEDGQTMVTPQQFGLLVVDWTDSRKVAEGATPVQPRHVHADLAVDILIALYDSDRRSKFSQ